jgi:hypothetical protein
MSENANYLFYSQNYCEHSKRCIGLIKKYDIANTFVLCNVDNQDLMIPPFITSVPTIYLSGQRQILTDNQLFKWIEQQRQAPQASKVMTMQQITGDESICAFTQSELGSLNGPSYSFIDDNANDMIASSFEMLDGSNKDKLTVPSFTRIDAIPQDSNSIPTNGEKDQRKSELTKAYDDLMKARAAEMQNNPMNQRI